jgi:large subunit ribosomal protein L25
MDEVVLQASRRTITGKQVNALRRAGKLPAVIYGRHIEAVPIELDLKESSRILERYSASALIVIDLDGERHYTLVREKQRNPLLGTLRHIDFQAVSLTEKVRADVRIILTGESPAVENYYGILVQNLESLEIEALPRDLPERIEVDVSVLKEIGDSLLVHDLSLPGEIEVLTDLDEAVVLVTAPVSEEVAEEEEALEGEAEPEVIERGRREEEEEE